MDSFNAANIKENVRWLTKKVHVAGTEENAELTKKIADEVKLILRYLIMFHWKVVLF